MSEKRAGRELDAEVAREVMGWTDCDPLEEYGDGFGLVVGFGRNDRGSKAMIPAYSTDIAAAFEVFETMADAGWLVEIAGKACHPGQWCAVMISVDGESVHDAVADTPALAICLAALQATRSTP